MTVSDGDLEELLAMLDRGRQSWVDGVLGEGEGLDAPQDDDMTIFGPFGGEAGWGPGLEERQKQAARLFHGGHGACELVKTMVSGDLVVIVLIERNEATVDGADKPQPWVLRTTQVFEKRPSGWVRLHRHADPLITRRSPADTFALARS
jgi:ketosteroid isomerase-like protein